MSDAAPPVPAGARPSLRTRVTLWWRRSAGWCARYWRQVRPGPEARRGAVWGTLAAAAICVVIAGLYLRSGFGYAFDFAFAIIFAAALIPLVALAVALLLTIARRLPRMATGMMIGCCAVVMLVWGPPQLGISMAIVMGLADGFLGATIATFLAARFGQAALSKKIVTTVLCLLAIAVNVWLVWLLAHSGSMDKIISWKPPAASMPAKLDAANPADTGPYRVSKLIYGAGQIFGGRNTDGQWRSRRALWTHPTSSRILAAGSAGRARSIGDSTSTNCR